MDGLDLLKGHWNKNDDFPKIDKEQIKHMLHKSSSSILKWIFLISVIELAVGILLSCTITIEKEHHSSLYTIFYVAFEVLFYIVVLYFMYRFFSSYRNIKNTINTKLLLENILNTRKHVNNYIKFNIYCIIFQFSLVSIEKIIQEVQRKPAGEAILFSMFMVVFVSLFCWLFLLVVRFYYKLLYRRLVHKLDHNYEELIKIEE
ncbi:hypothetical protein [Sphingobacterium griseoflavum]|uniref:Uncharacterized protein n=1 Tax=Sphingobacterium griseoflavum TaxID=1474952 RepID=A0ABQ3HVN2_9SPHI|nr:hypothetical protein [Sphingobacterium griseoflavum]GHE28422.1 hypothetical protein GCM10017764_08500 [Sphingobacterium griseoflavum]